METRRPSNLVGIGLRPADQKLRPNLDSGPCAERAKAHSVGLTSVIAFGRPTNLSWIERRYVLNALVACSRAWLWMNAQ